MRPVSITVSCIFLALASAITIGIAVLSGEIAPEMRMAMGHPLALFLSGIFALTCAIGYWRMRKWGVVLYTVAALLQLVVAGITIATELPLVIVILGFVNWSDLC